MNDVQSSEGLFGRPTTWFHWWEGGEGLPRGWYGWDQQQECWCVYDEELDEAFCLQLELPQAAEDFFEGPDVDWVEA